MTQLELHCYREKHQVVTEPPGVRTIGAMPGLRQL